MWYFSWVLGLGLAATVGILNALWFELRQTRMTASLTEPTILEDPTDASPPQHMQPHLR
ncbi:MAG: cytochrome bd-I oxidase subunit CydX [Pseudomonadota bacterium]